MVALVCAVSSRASELSVSNSETESVLTATPHRQARVRGKSLGGGCVEWKGNASVMVGGIAGEVR